MGIDTWIRSFMVGALACLAAMPAFADSLFSRQTAAEGTLISDKKVRFNKGDLITVLVQESISANTQVDTRARKESDVESVAAAAQNSFLVGKKPTGLNLINTGALPNWQVEAENEFRARGLTRRKSELTMVVSASVVEVTPSGNLVIEGTKRVRINREDSIITVRGTIRARDVTPENTILSNQISDAEIELEGQGPLWNNQRRGLFTKILDWFSPF